MTKHKTGTREEWLAARLELLEAEKELTRRSDELAGRRQELPWVRVDKEYRFETDEGSASLADLFRGRSQLLVYHFMFGGPTTRAQGCPSCSAIADRLRRLRRPLGDHDVTLSAVSRAPLAEAAGVQAADGVDVSRGLPRSAATSTTTSAPRSPRSSSAGHEYNFGARPPSSELEPARGRSPNRGEPAPTGRIHARGRA